MTQVSTARPGVFLTAEWRYLAMVNYAADPSALTPYLPSGVELDAWEGETFVSLVGFWFRHARVWGWAVPFHRDFEEVNLRFYVRRKVDGEWRRGVVFIKELVPRRAVAAVARVFYNERYEALPMRHRIEFPREDPMRDVSAAYEWRFRGEWNGMRLRTTGDVQSIAAGSDVEFIAEHHWGYSMQRDGSCVEYEVEHPSWLVWRVEDCAVECDAAALYGPALAEALEGPPRSAFLAYGSPVVVRRGRRIRGT